MRRRAEHQTVRTAVILFVGYVLLSQLSIKFILPPRQVATWWLPLGVTIAAVCRAPRRAWPALLGAVVLGEIVVCIEVGLPIPVMVTWAAANALTTLLGATLLRWLAGTQLSLARVRTQVVLMLAVALLATLPSSFLAAGASALWLDADNYWAVVRGWWVSDAIGTLVVLPLALSWLPLPHLRDIRSKGHLIEAVLNVGGIVVLTHLIFSSAPLQGAATTARIALTLPYAIFPLLVWSALRFGPRGTSTALAVSSLIAAWHTIHGRGPFSLGGEVYWNQVSLQLFLGAGSLTQLLASAYAELRDAIDARDRFLAVVAHELRTPLTPMLLNLQHLERRMPGDRTLVPSSIRQVRRLSRLVDDLLDVGRMLSGDLRLAREEVDLSTTVLEAVEDLRGAATAAGCTLDVDARAPAPVKGDPQRLAQIVYNLLSNAIKFGRGAPVCIRVTSVYEQVRLSVSDGGIGIAPADRERIFEPFERAVSEWNYGGVGLGLYITRQLVEAHGGRVGVDSRPGEGATFTVELPLCVISAMDAKQAA